MTATTLKLSDLAGPDADGWADVAVFVRADDDDREKPFVVGTANGLMVDIHYPRKDDTRAAGNPVRRLGRGRLVPARIEMQGEPAGADDTIRDLRRKLAEAGVEGSPPPGGQGTIPTLLARTQDAEEQVRKLRKALQLELVSLTSMVHCGEQYEKHRPCCSHHECHMAFRLRTAIAATAPTPTEERK